MTPPGLTLEAADTLVYALPDSLGERSTVEQRVPWLMVVIHDSVRHRGRAPRRMMRQSSGHICHCLSETKALGQLAVGMSVACAETLMQSVCDLAVLPSWGSLGHPVPFLGGRQRPALVSRRQAHNPRYPLRRA